MSFSRRRFLGQATALGLLSRVPAAIAQDMQGMKMGRDKQAKAAVGPLTQVTPRKPKLHTLQLAPFVDPLPVPQLLRPSGPSNSLTLRMREIHAKVHRDVPATRMWSYGEQPCVAFEARAGKPLEVTWINDLPKEHFLPIDYSLHGSGHDVPDVRTVAHLHGAKVQSKYDGYPEDWFGVGQQRLCIYPLQQEASTLWFHDHAMGINRLNTYAGMFGMALVRDDHEDALHLPSGRYEVPLILYDRDFTADGQLFYDTSGDEKSPWIPEFSADGLLVNGVLKPYFEVEPRLYRFRMLNTANSRFYILSLSENAKFVMVGSDQGLLAKPVDLQRFVLAPGERADLLIDFTQHAGKNILLRTGGSDMLQFRVAAGKASNAAYSVPAQLRSIERIPVSESVKTRTITLHEYKDEYERSMVMLLNRKHWHEPTTEFPKLNSTEIWEFVNLTEDTHPMHIHLVRFQVLDRRLFNAPNMILNKEMEYLAEATPPEPHEMGWKDVVQCPTGTVTRVIMRFEGFPGKYLYHCHILEHEANDMMRPFEVVA